MDEDSILVHQAGPLGIVKVNGRGSFRTARLVKLFGEQAPALGVSRIAYDLRDCTYMDSTFMGVMASLGAAQRKKTGVALEVYNPSPRNLELLQNLGLNHLLDIKTGPGPEPHQARAVELAAEPESKQEISEMMLDAHEALVELNPANAAQFQDVITFLRERLGLNVA
ncbi:MAG: STAS domain-containing protein [Verrucomicrobiia bacterium]